VRYHGSADLVQAQVLVRSSFSVEQTAQFQPFLPR